MADGNTGNIVKKAGRPTKITADIVKRLEDIFKLGVLDKVAINYVGIGERTYYDKLESDEVFRSQMQLAKNYARLAAGSVVMDAIVKRKDVETSKWWLEKKHSDEFSSGNKGQILIQQNFGDHIKSEIKEFET